MHYSEEIGLEKTDPKRWRIRTDDIGRTVWHYVSEDDDSEQLPFIKYCLRTDDFTPPAAITINSPIQAAEQGAKFWALLQQDNGSFISQYKGPTFITIGYIGFHYFCKRPIAESYRIEMIRFIVNSAHPVDGGWGLHTEDKSTCFGTTMGYISLRLLGLDASHPVCTKALKTLHHLGGAVKCPHWGKIWLAILNLYSWDGVNPAPPELWSMPYAVPIHPARWWVHTRAIYLPVGYIQANKLQCELDPLFEQIRAEIYLPSRPYESLSFDMQRNNVCGVDLYYPHTKILDFANYFLSKWEKLRPKWLLNATNKRVYELILTELKNTESLCIAPVSFAYNVIVTYVEEKKRGNLEESKVFRDIFDRIDDCVFHGDQGMTLMGTNGLQCWDVSFTIQYLMMAGLAEKPEFQDVIRKGYAFLERSQIREECVEGSFRDRRKGAWPFSTKDQGYTVSDTTSEALKAVIMVQNNPIFSDLSQGVVEQRLYDSVDLILSLQNLGKFEFGAFASYERIKATPLLEKLNPAEVFNNIMVEYPYVECSDLCVLGLTYFAKYYPHYRTEEVQTAIDNAIAYIVRTQRDDGSWYGSWGICFTYASMFALEALVSVGLTYQNSAAVKAGCDFLILKQMSDGGWSESIKSCETMTYVPGPETMVVQTAWALIGLILSGYPHRDPIEKGIRMLMDRQLPTGEWKYESIEGVFNHSCAIEYPSYRFLFPIKALGLFSKKYNQPTS